MLSFFYFNLQNSGIVKCKYYVIYQGDFGYYSYSEF